MTTFWVFQVLKVAPQINVPLVLKNGNATNPLRSTKPIDEESTEWVNAGKNLLALQKAKSCTANVRWENGVLEQLSNFLVRLTCMGSRSKNTIDE